MFLIQLTFFQIAKHKTTEKQKGLLFVFFPSDTRDMLPEVAVGSLILYL